MEIGKVFVIVFCLLLAGVIYVPAAWADVYNEQTKLVFNEPVEIPGRVLPAGTYWFVLQDNDSDRNVVQIFSGDWSKLETTLLAVPTLRQQPTNETEIEFAERPHDKPEALLKWYYPGNVLGHEFIYRPKHEKEFDRDTKQNVVGKPLIGPNVATATGN